MKPLTFAFVCVFVNGCNMETVPKRQPVLYLCSSQRFASSQVKGPRNGAHNDFSALYSHEQATAASVVISRASTDTLGMQILGKSPFHYLPSRLLLHAPFHLSSHT